MSGNGSSTGSDLAVVGGGIVGAFVAHEAARRNLDHEVVVLERGTPGTGATSWSAGADFPLAATAGHRELVTASRRGYDAFRGTPLAAFVRSLPMVYVAAGEDLERLRSRSTVGLRPVDPAERRRIADMLPGVRIEPDEQVVTGEVPGFAVAARGLTEALLRHAGRRRGVSVHTGRRVVRITRADGGYALHTNEEVWRARRVVLATGPWPLPEPLVEALGTGVGGAVGARRKRVAALRTRLPVRTGDPLVYFVADDLFFLPLGVGSCLVSFRRDEWDSDPDALDGSADGDDLRAGTSVLAGRIPDAASTVVGGQSFCDLYTPDRLPLVLTAASLPGLAAVVGGSGSGVRLAPGLAAAALRVVTEVQPATAQRPPEGARHGGEGLWA